MDPSLPLICINADNHCTHTVAHNPGGGDEAPLHVVAVDHGQSDDQSQDIRDQEKGDQWTPSFLRLGIKKRNCQAQPQLNSIQLNSEKVDISAVSGPIWTKL